MRLFMLILLLKSSLIFSQSVCIKPFDFGNDALNTAVNSKIKSISTETDSIFIFEEGYQKSYVYLLIRNGQRKSKIYVFAQGYEKNAVVEVAESNEQSYYIANLETLYNLFKDSAKMGVQDTLGFNVCDEANYIFKFRLRSTILEKSIPCYQYLF